MNDAAPQVPNFRALRIAVRHNTSLSASARLLFEDICDLAEKTGECVAMDEHFQRTYGAKPRTVRDWLKELREADVLRSEGATNRRRLIPNDPQLRRSVRLNLGRTSRLSDPNLGGPAVTNLGGFPTRSIEYLDSERGEGESGPVGTFDPVAAYAEAFPDFEPNIHQLVELGTMTDRAAFMATLDVWRLNDYQPRHLVNFRDRYGKILRGEAGADGATTSPRQALPVDLSRPVSAFDRDRAISADPSLTLADFLRAERDGRGEPTYVLVRNGQPA